MKLTPGLNFINVLLTAIMLAEPKSVKKTIKSLFTLSGSTSIKAERKYVGEIEPWCPFINILWAAFARVEPKHVKTH